jgi:hypothetical protein
MSRAPCDDLEDALHKMADSEVKSVVKELSGYLQQMRGLESDSTETKPPPISGVARTRSFDNGLVSRAWDPFAAIPDFHKHLRFGEPLDYWDHEPEVVEVHGNRAKIHCGSSYGIMFTHADIAPRNIRVRGDKITGVIDWGFAGWYPEYRECTRMFYWGNGCT